MTTLTSRLYEDENDFQQMQNLLIEARSLTNDWHYAQVGELIFNFFMVVCHLNPREHIRLWHEKEKLVGYAILGEDPSFDWQVLPDHEWSGIEVDVLRWAVLFLVILRSRGMATLGSDPGQARISRMDLC